MNAAELVTLRESYLRMTKVELVDRMVNMTQFIEAQRDMIGLVDAHIPHQLLNAMPEEQMAELDQRMNRLISEMEEIIKGGTN